MKVLVFIGSTLEVKARSGVQRLVVEVAKKIGDVVAVDFVKWDPIEGQLRYLDASDLTNLLGTADISIKPNRFACRIQYRFGDTLEQPEETWLLFPEVSHLQENGNEIFDRALSQVREYGVRVAAIFYDIIPITNEVYSEGRGQHIAYVASLLRCDLIIAISQTSAQSLRQHYETGLGQESAEASIWSEKIVSVLLPEINSETPPFPSLGGEDERDIIIMVGTVEPRKRQIQALQAISQLQARGAISPQIETHIYGSLHPFVSEQLPRLLEANPRIRYFNYAKSQTIEASYKRAMFSVFASNDEGYGLPIAESLARGVPCLTANFGAMAEIAAEGGCLICDVNDQNALADAISQLCNDSSLRHRLRDEISARRFRDWEDYCQEIVAILAAKNAQIKAARNTLDVALHTALRSPHPTDVTVDDQRVTTIDVAPDTRFVTIDQDDSPHGQYTIFRFTGSARTIPDWDSEITTRALCADVWGITDANAAQVLINRARELKFAALLPREVVEDPNQTSLDAALTSRAAQIVLKDRQRADIAANERLFQRALRYWKNTALLEEPTLAVVISTYNRALFVEANVSWLVRAAKTLGDIRIVVVDNASTDDTVSRLEKFIIEPCFSLIVNSQNVGMLGNLRVCSTLFAARHIWLTGDDDFIVPEQLSAILKILRDDPGLPLICMNFAVYLRERLLPSDSVKMIISEGSEIAGRKLKSGIYPVNVVVTQHDNLFTAIYPIIFRSDLLAACFNYPFDGKPFETLTECVPTTKWFLENFRFADCYWHAPVSVVGNAYNSWSHHRPRWHGVIMPQVFELARDAGADATILHQFAQLHIDLYDDALEIARRTRTPVSISAADLAPARRVFRQELALP